MPHYSAERIEGMLSEWSETEDTEVISMGDVSNNKELPAVPTLERRYPSVRDALVQKGYKYRRNDWTTEISFEEDEYPESLNSSKERDVYAYAQENDLKGGKFREVAEELDLPFPYIAEKLGPL